MSATIPVCGRCRWEPLILRKTGETHLVVGNFRLERLFSPFTDS